MIELACESPFVGVSCTQALVEESDPTVGELRFRGDDMGSLRCVYEVIILGDYVPS